MQTTLKRFGFFTPYLLVILSLGMAQEEPVQVHAYINTGVLNRLPEGSAPAKLAEVNAYVAEQTGVEIVPILPPTDGAASEQKLNLLLSSSERLDMFVGDWTQYFPAAIPLNDLLEQHGQNIVKAWPQEAWDKMTDKDGMIWAIPKILPVATYPVWVRTDLLEELNLDMPQTVDELEAFMEAYQASDPNAIPLLVGSLGDLRGVLLGAFAEHGNSPWVDPEDGELKPAELQPGFRDWVVKMADWYAKGYINRDTFGNTDGNALRDIVSAQKVGATATWYSIVTLSSIVADGTDTGVKYAYTNITGPAGKAQTILPATTNGVIITKRAPNPEAIVKFIDWQFADVENFLTTFYGLEDEGWERIEEAQGAVELDPDIMLVKEQSVANGYAGEINWSLGLPMETKYVTLGEDNSVSPHAQYLTCCIADLSVGKTPVDAGVAYNIQEVRQVFPNQQDWERYVEENVSNFITGARPLSEWDAFTAGMDRVGLASWIEAYNTQYQEQNQ